MTLEKIKKIRERNEKAREKNEKAYQWGGESRYLSASRRNDELVSICNLAVSNIEFAKRAEEALLTHNIDEQQTILKEMIKKTEYLIN